MLLILRLKNLSSNLAFSQRHQMAAYRATSNKNANCPKNSFTKVNLNYKLSGLMEERKYWLGILPFTSHVIAYSLCKTNDVVACDRVDLVHCHSVLLFHSAIHPSPTRIFGYFYFQPLSPIKDYRSEGSFPF